MYSEQLHDSLMNSGCDWEQANFSPTKECSALNDEMFGVWNKYFNFYNMFQRKDGTPLFAEPKEGWVKLIQ